MSSKEIRLRYSESVPCRGSCPADTDIPGYLEAIYHGDYDKAYDINFNDNFFPEILGEFVRDHAKNHVDMGRMIMVNLYQFVSLNVLQESFLQIINLS